MKLIVGLGNPGAKYNATRHNVGFSVLDQACQDETPKTVRGKMKKLLGVEWAQNKRMQAETFSYRVGSHDVLMVKPTTYMNLSGEAVQALMTDQRVKLEDVLVICDDMDLPVGVLRLKRNGGAGGHHGLESIIGKIGEGFARLRVGIGHPIPGAQGKDHVLERFSLSERPVMGATVARAADAVKLWMTDGVEAAMNRYNASPSSPSSPAL